jgi:hypothetical protein
VTVDHGDPSELMAEFVAIAQEMAAIQSALKQELMEAKLWGVSEKIKHDRILLELYFV